MNTSKSKLKLKTAQRPDETNVEFVTRLMNFPRSGAMMQLVVIEALGRYAKAVVEAGLDKVREEFGENSAIHPDAWYRTCQELHNEIEAKYGHGSKQTEVL